MDDAVGRELVVVINSGFMERCASSTLSGYLVDKFGTEALKERSNIVLEFEERSYGWCRENGGPDSWIMSEFSVRLLIENILCLERMGFKVSTRVKVLRG